MQTADEVDDLDGTATCTVGVDVATMDLTEPLTVSEVAGRIGLTTHTLRWYERIGLLEQVGRDSAGHRRYTATDVEWLVLLVRLRATGMPVRDMQRYAELVRAGDHTATERRDLLEAHRARVAAHIEELGRHLAVIDYKVTIYRDMEHYEQHQAS